MRRSLLCRSVFLGLGLALACTARGQAPDAGAAASALAKGDLAWERRGDGQREGRAAAGPIGEAVAAYEQALTADRKNLATRAKLLRALWFQGEYATADNAGKQKVFERGKTVGEEGIDQLAAGLGGRAKLDDLEPAAAARALQPAAEATPVFFWSAVHWGLWGDAFGKFAAARQGVAGKIRDRCLIVLALDERIEDGGGHRVLGRLHALAPHIPFITGWIDHKNSIVELRQALTIGPEDQLNRQYLAEALLEYGDGPAAKTEARTILQGIVDHPPVPEKVTEWAAAQAIARRLLAVPN